MVLLTLNKISIINIKLTLSSIYNTIRKLNGIVENRTERVEEVRYGKKK